MLSFKPVCFTLLFHFHQEALQFLFAFCHKGGVICISEVIDISQMVKCLSTMRETQVQSLGQEDPLEKEMAIHSSTIAWKIPWTEEPGRLQSMGPQRVGHD